MEGWQGGPSGGIDVTRDWLDPYTGEIHTGIVPPTTQQQVDKAFGQGGIAAALDLARMAGEAGESQVQAIYDLKNTSAGTAAKIANIQELIGYERCLPSTLAREQKVADLQQSIMDLQKSTDTLNGTNQRTNELLSPYYSQDPRTSHIGFRSQGMAGGGYVDVPGGMSANDNMWANIPVASGERIYVDPMGARRGTGGGSVVNNISISSPVLIQGNANKDEIGRTMFQNNQALAKQLKSATR